MSILVCYGANIAKEADRGNCNRSADNLTGKQERAQNDNPENAIYSELSNGETCLKSRLSPFILSRLALVRIYRGFATTIFSTLAMATMATVVNTFNSGKDIEIV